LIEDVQPVGCSIIAWRMEARRVETAGGLGSRQPVLAKPDASPNHSLVQKTPRQEWTASIVNLYQTSRPCPVIRCKYYPVGLRSSADSLAAFSASPVALDDDRTANDADAKSALLV